MSKVIIFHNPHCGSSKNALAVADELGVDYEVVLYMKEPLDQQTLKKIVDGLDGPVEDLVRKDSVFKKLNLDPDDYVGNPDAVVELLMKRKALLQRPIVLKGNKAVIGRPKEKIRELLTEK